MKKLRKITKVVLVIAGMLTVLAAFIYSLTGWMSVTFGVTIQEILYTLVAPLKGSDTHFISGAVKHVVPRVLMVLGIYLVAAYIRIVIDGHNKVIKALYTSMLLIGSIVAMVIALRRCDSQLAIVDFVKARVQSTHIYEDYYIDPDTVEISSDGDTKNLIYIYGEYGEYLCFS